MFAFPSVGTVGAAITPPEVENNGVLKVSGGMIAAPTGCGFIKLSVAHYPERLHRARGSWRRERDYPLSQNVARRLLDALAFIK